MDNEPGTFRRPETSGQVLKRYLFHVDESVVREHQLVPCTWRVHSNAREDDAPVRVQRARERVAGMAPSGIVTLGRCGRRGGSWTGTGTTGQTLRIYRDAERGPAIRGGLFPAVDKRGAPA
jgi:hypothetical protein